MKNILHILTITLLLTSTLTQQSTQQPQYQNREQQDPKIKTQRQQMAVRDSIGMVYGENTETLTFNISHICDFVVKTQENQDVKASMHVYWKEDNVYVGSQYRIGENVRVLVYEDNYRILLDTRFYITHGFKFLAEKGKTYTVRFIDEGRISKLIALEISKTITTKDGASKDHIQQFSTRMQNIASQLKVLSSISQFTVVMHEKGARSMNHSICIYMSYLIGEAVVILAIVGLQIKLVYQMLGTSSIV